MLGPPLETYTFSKPTLALVVIFAALVELPFYLVGSESATVQGINAVVLGLFTLWIVWLMSVQLSLHMDGLSYRSLFGTREMRWDEIERFTYVVSMPSYGIGFGIAGVGIPLGTYYEYKLVDSHGRKLSIGMRLGRLREMGDQLLEYTFQPLFEKLGNRFNAGEELDFGLVRLSRDYGLKVKSARWSQWIPISWTGFRTIPLDQLYGYKMEEGALFFWRSAEEKTWGLPVGGIPNAHVLLGLLDNLYGQPEES